jgi:hypothetical protein
MGVLSLKMTQDDMTLKIVQEGKCEIYKEIFFERAIAARFPAPAACANVLRFQNVSCIRMVDAPD